MGRPYAVAAAPRRHRSPDGCARAGRFIRPGDGAACHHAPMAVSTPRQIDRARIARAHRAARSARLNERTQASQRDVRARADDVLSGGVASSYQLRDPWPIYLERGDGPEVWDVDGNEMWDFHNGFGSMVQGHAHPAIGAAVQRALRARARTSRRRPRTRSSSARSSSARWGLPQWRYTNSGSESTMDAIRIARAYTGRDTIAEDLRLLPRPPRRA